MKKMTTLFTCLILLISTSITHAHSTITDATAKTTASQQQNIEEVTQLLKQHPALIDDLLLSIKHYVAQDKKVLNTLQKHHDYLFYNPLHSQIDSANNSAETSLTIINFTDYNCPFCKRLDSVLTQLVASRPMVKVVNIYVPLRQQNPPGSVTNSAEFALNVWQHAPQHYQQVHDLMIKKPGMHSADSLHKIAEMSETQTWLVASQEKEAMIKKNYQLFMALGLQGTPAMLINNKILPGYMDLANLTAVADQAIAKKQLAK